MPEYRNIAFFNRQEIRDINTLLALAEHAAINGRNSTADRHRQSLKKLCSKLEKLLDISTYDTADDYEIELKSLCKPRQDK